MKAKILVVDDDPNISDLVRLYLEKESYDVKTAEDGEKALDLFYKWTPDLLVLDVMMPKADGWEVAKQVRKVSAAPIIMLSARGETFDKVLSLELGADDYIVKPFEPKEFIARIKAVLRRTMNQSTTSEEVVFSNLIINKSNYTTIFNGKKIEMPPKELELLYFLASHKNQLFTREQLIEKVWGFDFTGDGRTVDVHVKRLREKLTDETSRWEIKTVWGVGYKFEVKS